MSNDFIFNQQITTQPLISYELYTFLGDHDYIDDDGFPRTDNDTGKVIAKVRHGISNTKYFIKVGSHGQIFNPIGMYSEGKQTKFLSKIGKLEFAFREVNKNIFDMYLNFTKTKNIAWLNNAQREMS
jgi:hypothetical protein